MEERIIETSLSIEFKDLHPREMEFYKDCFAKLIDIKNKIIIPGQIMLNINEKGELMRIEVKGLAYKRPRGLDKTI